METAGHLFWRAVLRGYLRGYHRFRVVHRELLPQRTPFVLIANHASHLDALALCAAMPLQLCDHVFPIAAGDVFFRTTAKAWFAAVFINALPMWRKNCGAHALQDLRSRLATQDCGYILFPEGTRSRDGVLQDFKCGLGMLVAGSEIPVIPCHLHGAFHALPPDRWLPRPRRLTLRVGLPLFFRDTPNDRAGWDAVTRICQQAVAELRVTNVP